MEPRPKCSLHTGLPSSLRLQAPLVFFACRMEYLRDIRGDNQVNGAAGPGLIPDLTTCVVGHEARAVPRKLEPDTERRAGAVSWKMLSRPRASGGAGTTSAVPETESPLCCDQ